MAEYNPNVDQFDLQRKRAEQQVGAQTQNQQEALKRRFAAAGALNSGAAIQQQNLASEQGAQNLNQVNEGINAQQNQEMQRQKEVQQGREFATSERLGSQGFAAEQAGLGREFAKSERLGGQDWQSQQADIQRKFQTGERLSAQDYGALQAGLQRNFQESQFGRQLEQSKNQFDAQFKQQQKVDEWNYILGNKALDQKGWMDSLLGPLAGGIGGKAGGLYGSTVGYTPHGALSNSSGGGGGYTGLGI